MAATESNSMVGLWVDVPFAGPGRCIAHVVRQRGPVLFVYYFAADQGFDIDTAEPGDAFYAEVVGFLGIRNGEWPILGRTVVDRAHWPLIEHARPYVVQGADVVHLAIRVADDLDTEIGRREISASDAADMPPYGQLAGHKAAEIHVKQRMRASPQPMKTHPWWPHQFNAPPAPANPPSAPELPVGVKILISDPWRGSVRRLIKRLERAVPAGDEVDGWEAGPMVTVFLYGRELEPLVRAARRAGRAARLPRTTAILATTDEGETLLREPLW